MDQNWYKTLQEPIWSKILIGLINKVPNEDTRYRTLINLSVKYQIQRLISVSRLVVAPTMLWTKNNTRMYAGTSPILCGMNAAGTGTNGRYSYNESK